MLYIPFSPMNFCECYSDLDDMMIEDEIRGYFHFLPSLSSLKEEIEFYDRWITDILKQESVTAYDLELIYHCNAQTAIYSRFYSLMNGDLAVFCNLEYFQ